MPVYSAESPLTCVAFGSGQALDHFDELSRASRHRGPSLVLRLAHGVASPPASRGRADASRIRNGSTGARNRGVSTFTSTTLSASRSGTTQIHFGAARTNFVKAPASASRHRIQKLITPSRATLIGSEIADADACHANEPSSSSSRRVLWYATANGENGWSEM